MNNLPASKIHPARFLAILIAAILVSCMDLFKEGDSNAGTTSEEYTTLTGTVIDIHGKPVKGVIAELTVSKLVSVTGEDGVYHFSVEKRPEGLAKTASVQVYDTLSLSYKGQRFYLLPVTQWGQLAPVVMASKSISGTVPMRRHDIMALTADLNPTAPVERLNAKVEFIYIKLTGEFHGIVYYEAGLQDKPFIIDIQAVGLNGEIVISDFKITFTHGTSPVARWEGDICSHPATVTDACDFDRECVPFKPIWQAFISKECKSCHPAEGGLRLDHWIRAYPQLLGKDTTGEAVYKKPLVPNPKITKRVVPYFPEYSLLYDVLTGEGSAEYGIVLMPEEHKPTKALVDTIRAWIYGGAKYKCP